MTTTRTYILFILFTLLCPAFLRAGDKKAVAAGSFHALVLKQDGTLWSFGRNFSGALGVGGDVDSSPEPIKIMDDVVQISAQNETSMAVKADGSLWAWGQNDKGQLVNRTEAMASFGSAAMDNEECWAYQSILRSLGLVYIEHQARL